ncbi:MAG TPA: mannosyltransferase family protein [Vicinamibacterales bacterium]|nr:mannosyltransferase family protein [Vicinamibacterales bacterium]
MTRLPRWAAWLDAIAIILLVVAAKAALSGAVRLALPVDISIASPWRPALLALVLLVFRHWRAPAPTLPQRVAHGAALWRREPQAFVFRVWVASRVGVLLVALFAVLIIGTPPNADTRVSYDPIRDLPARWDAFWYAGIAREGYSYDPRVGASGQQTIAFFPAYPMLLRAADLLTYPRRTLDMTLARHYELRDSRLMWAGTFLSMACFLAALLVLYQWVARKHGVDAAAAAVVFTAAYPFAVFYSAAYTEGLFLLAAIVACSAFERERWLAAAVAGLVAGLTRPNGAMLSLTLGVLAITPVVARAEQARRSLPRLLPAVAVAAMPGVGMLLYSAFIYSLTGDGFAWVSVQQAWGRSLGETMSFFEVMWNTVRSEGVAQYVRIAPIGILQGAAALFALVMTWPVWRRLGAAYGVFMLANLLPPLLRGGVLSMGRMTSTLFPMFAALAMVVPAERRPLWVLSFALGQGLIATLFYTWRAVY